MPLWSVQEWRARIGTSWCALGRPIRSRSFCCSCYGSPPPGGDHGGRRAKSHYPDVDISVIIMIVLWIGAVLTLWHLILGGNSPVFTSWFECTSLDLVMLQCILSMSLLSKIVSQAASRFLLLSYHQLKVRSSLNSRDPWDMCGLIYHFSKCQNYDLIVVIYLCKEKLMSARPLRAGMMSLFNATVCNFLQKLMKGIKQALSVAIIKASLLLRCGDVELNPGPLGTIPTPPSALSVLLPLASHWKGIGLLLRIDHTTLVTIEDSCKFLEDCLQKMLSRWFEVDPMPTWDTLADAVEPFSSSKAIEIRARMNEVTVDATHEETSKQLFHEAMCEEGHVSLRTVVLLLIGVAGAGKTCFSHLLFNEPPPPLRESTPLAQASIRAVSLSRATALVQEDNEVVWEHVSSHKLNSLIASIIKGIRDLLNKTNRNSTGSVPQRQPPSQSPQPSNADSATRHEYQEEQGNGDHDASSTDHIDHSTAESDNSRMDVEQLFEIESVKELISLISKSKGSEEISKQEWVYIIDSGGQPQFHDLLPTFVRHVSAAVFFVKLNEMLNDYPEIKYYSKGGDLSGRPYLSTQNHLQIIQNCLQAMQSRSQDDDNKYCPDLFFVGTHRDQEHRREMLVTKNERLQQILLDHALFRNHFVSQTEDHLLYQVNSKNPTDEDWKVVNNFRKAVMETHTHEVKVPIRWFVLEQLLQQLSVDDVISFSQCLEVAGHLRMKEEHLKAALTYLAKLNIFEYFPYILPNVVFTSSQVLLTKITELVEYSHYLQNGSKLNVRSVDIHFRDYGELTIDMLKRKEFSRHYIPGLFEEDDLLRLWEELLVIAKHDSNTFVMPAVLSALPQDKLSDHRLPMDISSVDIIPLALYYQGGLFPSGIFASLISYLQNKCGWMISMQRKKPKCLHRNCITFSVTGVVEANVTLIYFHDWIELHIINLYNEDKQVSCHLLQKDLFSGLNHVQTVQKYDKLQPKRAFFCNCRIGSDLHLASVTPTMLQCSLDTTRREKLPEKCKIWLCFSDAMINELFSNAEGHTVQIEKTTSQKRGSFAVDLQEEQGSSEQVSSPPLPKRPRKSKQDQQHLYGQQVYDAATLPGGVLPQPNVHGNYQDVGASLSHNYTQAAEPMHPIPEGGAGFNRATSTPLSQSTQLLHGYGPQTLFQAKPMYPTPEEGAGFSCATSYQFTPFSQSTQHLHGYDPRAPFQGQSTQPPPHHGYGPQTSAPNQQHLYGQQVYVPVTLPGGTLPQPNVHCNYQDVGASLSHDYTQAGHPMYSAPGGMPNYSFGYPHSQSTQPPQYGYGLQTPAQAHPMPVGEASLDHMRPPNQVSSNPPASFNQPSHPPHGYVSQPPIPSDGAHLKDGDHTSIYNKLEDKAAKWRDIGKQLGFREGEMDNIQSNPVLSTQGPPKSYLREMLSQWLQWAPGDRRGSTSYATKGTLHAALLRANLGQLAEQFQ